ncbi:MAG: AAA family ATPase [Proteobacteria bacterium]|nr:MAG: AAA family ATPase [Pseudomonadota bacterium]
MIVYSETKTRFREDVFSNKIETVILDLFKTKMKRSIGTSEVASWKNSMQYMDRILEDAGIPDDSRVGIEYTIPQSAKRIDFLLTGKNAQDQDTVVIIELKQWQQVKPTVKDAIVRTALGGAEVETTHPSYQAWTYAALLEDYNETVQKEKVRLFPCAYLHNCVAAHVVRSPFYAEHLKKAPVFVREDAQALRDFIKQHVKHGDRGDLLYRIEHGRIRPSKNLADALLSMLQGNPEFKLIDDQKLVYETALSLAGEAQVGGKQVLIVEGGPGTGKSVVAINLLVELTRRELVAQYASRNAAPRAVYESKLVGHFRKSRISNLFAGSGAFLDAAPDVFDALIVDEAHRLNEKSGLYQNLGENQIKEIMRAAKLSIFFIDEDQRVTLNDIGEKAEIRRWAESLGATVQELALESQFRCNGSDGYLAWVDHALQIHETANVDLDGIDFEFRVCDSASQLRDAIFERNQPGNKARLVAGYCWPWTSKKDPSAMDIVFPGTDFAMQWNLADDGSLWIVKPDSVKEVGCIHTCQGLELEYVGVIIGADLVVRDGRVEVDVSKRARADRTVHGYKKLAKANPAEARQVGDRIVKNTYRTLMTRGSKGCFVFCVDPETNAYFKSFVPSLAR